MEAWKVWMHYWVKQPPIVINGAITYNPYNHQTVQVPKVDVLTYIRFSTSILGT